MTSLFRTTPVVAFAFSFGNYAHAHPGHAHEIVPSAEYWHYVVQPEHALVLLVAIVAAIALTMRRRKDSKYQDPAQQVQVRRADRVRMVKMRSEKRH